MSQNANNMVYRVEWTGVHTKWDYRLDIVVPPEEYHLGLDLVDPSIIKLPIAAVRLNKLSIKYSDYIGAPEIPTLDLDIDLSEIPEPLLKALTQPAITYYSDAGSIDAGVVFHLYIKHNYNDFSDPVDYRFIKSFIYYVDGRLKYKLDDQSINIQPIDINFAILRSLSFSNLNYTDFTKFTSSYIYEAFSVDGTKYPFYYVGNDTNPPNPQFKFVKFMDLINWIKTKTTLIKRLLTRDSTAVYSLDVSLPKFYKQTTDINGGEGDELSITDIYLLAYILWDDEVVGGLFSLDDENSLYKTYPNSVADFINELSEFNLRQLRSGSIGIDMNPSYFTTIELDINHIYDVTFMLNEERIKSVTCSLYESNDDADAGGDIDKRVATIWGSRNEASWTIPVVFNNIITNIARSGWIFKKGNIPMVKNLYYIDKPFSYYVDDRPIRVHEYVVYELKYYASDNPSSYDVNKSLIRRDYNNTINTALGTQVVSGIPNLLAKFALRCFKGGMDVFECTIELNYNVEFSPGGSHGNPWILQNYANYLFNITNYDTNNSYLTYLANNWKLVDVDIDFVTELVKAKFIRLKL